MCVCVCVCAYVGDIRNLQYITNRSHDTSQGSEWYFQNIFLLVYILYSCVRDTINADYDKIIALQMHCVLIFFFFFFFFFLVLKPLPPPPPSAVKIKPKCLYHNVQKYLPLVEQGYCCNLIAGVKFQPRYYYTAVYWSTDFVFTCIFGNSASIFVSKSVLIVLLDIIEI